MLKSLPFVLTKDRSDIGLIHIKGRTPLWPEACGFMIENLGFSTEQTRSSEFCGTSASCGNPLALDQPNTEWQCESNFMGMLEGKRILITGLLSNRSIAYGVAKAMHREGAELAFTFQGENIRERLERLAPEFGSDRVFPCDVASDEEIAAMFAQLGQSWDGLDGIVHAIAYAPREALAGDFHETVTRENFRVAHDISSYSLAALVKGGLPLMQGRKAAVVAMTFLGAVRAVPNYNVMGLAKASLEACVRYLAFSLGPAGIRINGISAGPIKTLAAAGVGSFNKLLGHVESNSPLRRNVTTEEVGNTAAFLCSDLASGINGEITYVDGGFGISGLAKDH